MTEQEEVKLFDAPDLAALQRNSPRIALRASVLVLVPTLVALLAKSLDLYRVVSSIPLPLGFLAVGPFAYEAKVIASIVAVFLGLAYLVPKRTAQLVIGVCVVGVLWTGHVFISLQWARLFATSFHFRQESVPGPLAWVYAILLLTVGVVYLLIENLLETRAQQEARKLAGDDTRALFEVSSRALALMLAVGFGIALALVAAYLGLRALLLDARLPFRLNPVFVLFAMGVALAVLVALAARKRSPIDAGVLAAMAARPLLAPTPAPSPRPSPPPSALAPSTLARKPGRFRAVEWVILVLAGFAVLSLVLPWQQAYDGVSMRESTGFAVPGGYAVLAAAILTPIVFLRARGAAWRFGPTGIWSAAVLALWGQIAFMARVGLGDAIGGGLAVAMFVSVLASFVSLFAMKRSWRTPPREGAAAKAQS